MDWSRLPMEIQLMIIPRLSNTSLRQVMLVNRQLSEIARPHLNDHSVIILRGTTRLENFANIAQRTNRDTGLRTVYHLRFEDYNTEANRVNIFTVLTNVDSIRTLYFYRLNIRRALPTFNMFAQALRPPPGPPRRTHELFLPPPGEVNRITLDPLPRQVDEQLAYLNLCEVYHRSIEHLIMPAVHHEEIGVLHALSRLPRLRTLILPFSIPLSFDSILVRTRGLQVLELVYIPVGNFRFTVFSRDREDLLLMPNMRLRQFRFGVMMISLQFLQLISQQFHRLTHISLIGDLRNHARLNNIFLRAPIMPNVTHLQILGHRQIHQILPGIMHTFPQVVDLTLSGPGINAGAAPLNLARFNLATLHIDVNLTRRSDQVVLTVASTTRRAIYVWEVDDLRYIEADQLPANVIIVEVSMIGLQRLHLFDSSNRYYRQDFDFDQ